MSGLEQQSEQYIFRALTFIPSQGTYKFRNDSPLSYTRAREITLEAYLNLSDCQNKITACIAWESAALLLQLILMLATGCLKDMADGNLKKLVTDKSLGI